MKKLFISAVAALSLAMLLNGCIAVGTGPKNQNVNPTLGQQLIDLKTARDNGAISQAEYDAQKAKLLSNSPDNSPAK
jgi:hypothetical protein